MTINIMRKHIAWMPQQDFDAMRKRDEEVGKILGWKKIIDEFEPFEEYRWLSPDCRENAIPSYRDDSNELADEHETDTGLPFFSYSLNGAGRILSWIATHDAVIRNMFYKNLQQRASWGSDALPAWPECLTALIPELPRHICEALITTYNQLEESNERQRDIEAFKNAHPEAIGRPTNAQTETKPTCNPWTKVLRREDDDRTSNRGKIAKGNDRPTIALARKFEKKEWFGICPLDNGDMAIKIDETEYNLTPALSRLLKDILNCMLVLWEEQTNKSWSIDYPQSPPRFDMDY